MRAKANINWLTSWEYAHRGLHSLNVPENSSESVNEAIRVGLGIEIDVQRSADGYAMVHHDWDLKRMTGLEGSIAAYSAETLRTFRLLANGEGLSPLSDVLQIIKGRVPLLCEIKSKPGYDVTRSCIAVHEDFLDYDGPYAVMSFDPKAIIWFKRNAPQTVTGLVIREDKKGPSPRAWQRRWFYWKANPDFLAYHIDALPNGWVAGLRKKGIPVLAWAIDSPTKRRRALFNADGLIGEGKGLA